MASDTPPAEPPSAVPSPDTARIPPLPPEEWDETLRAVVAATGPLHVFTTLARHPGLFPAWLGFGSKLLFEGTLDGRVREIAILRVAHQRSCAYEWTHHVPIARAAGLTEAEIEALKGAPDAHPWPSADRAVIDAADELHASSTVSDATWAALAERFDEAGLIELIMLIGQYHMLAFTLNALRVQAEPGH
ncbi:carboxymuconolactone decarboxylase family protein [Actinomadura logoneensis]|uniref:Carboxymuconolactone decarboxylase family protein n=1 Tax=Actinomadura logoneensis TaxID=2293572 RepID=A0A372JMT7_9ACTN|nr:carboxymuconolactone decarboxylase family protein [Actinomadura logoneensis]RFU41325.1 carboxymuconolactone decarboxylase family protein [Actinomadura logoneensis]